MITGVLIGKDKLVPFLRSIPANVEEALRKEIEALAIKLVGKIKKEKLSGTVLKNRSGILRGSIHETMEVAPNRIFARVGTNKEYAAIHEYGFDGVVTVREHLRMQVVAFGKAMKTPKSVTVKSHTAHMRMPERSFLRSSLKEMNEEIRDRIVATLKRIASNGK